MHTDLIPTAEAAEMLGVSTRTLNRWADAERIVPAAVGPGPKGARLFDRRDVLLLASDLKKSA